MTGDKRVFSDARVGDNNKIVIPPSSLTNSIPTDFVRPIVRTYTIRAIDYKQNLMTIDFVAQGKEGPASAWAAYAQNRRFACRYDEA